MKVISLIFIFSIVINLESKGQTSIMPVWTETDRKYLIDNLTRTRQEIIDETKNLSKAQWMFKESNDRWNINQIVEHIAIWELLFMREVSQALANKPDSTFTNYPSDSAFLDNDPKGLNPKNALEYTKPFSFAVPLGNNAGANNVIWFSTMRNESIVYLKNETRNIRLAYDKCSGMNVHHYYMIIFGHADNHLKQIRKVKRHPNYPK